MSNLLDKASILLTPTAYNDGSMLSVKPENGDGDFTFSRSSAATRVNAQGLVENVQIISSELVSNGDFSQIGTEEVLNGNFSQEGSELIVNGDFATDSDWVKSPSGLTISGGSANFTSGQDTYVFQDIMTVGKQYFIELEYNITSLTGSAYFGSNVGSGNSIISMTGLSGSGTLSGYITASATRLIVRSSTLVGSIDNVSVKEVGQNWAIENTWTIGDGVANGNGANGITEELVQLLNFDSSKKYEISYQILNYVSGSVRYSLSGGGGYNGQNKSANGTYVDFINTGASHTQIKFFGLNFIGSITNISVKEVGQDWTFGTGWSMGDGFALHTGSTGNLETNTSLSINKKYKVQFEILTIADGVCNIYDIGSATTYASFTTTGIKSAIITKDSTGVLAIRSNSTNVTIDNISVKEITDDTDIPRINYSGFSYQDVLGSELVVNGDFSVDSDWSKGDGWSIGSGKANCDGTQTATTNFYQSNVISDQSKTYKVEFTLSNYVSGLVKSKISNDAQGLNRTANGTYIDYLSGMTNNQLNFTASSDFIGSIDNVSVKEYLGQEVVPDSGCGSWLLEPQSTNTVTYSEDFSQWSNVSTTLTSSYLAPDGTLGATKISGTIGTSYIALGSTSSQTATRTIWARTVSGTGTAKLMSYYQNTNNLFTLTEKWQRFELNGAIATGGTSFYVDFRDNSQTLNEFIIWGAQSEALSYATSYIPTNGATNTRLQDIATNSGNASLINSTEGVLYAEIAALADDTPNSRISLSYNHQNYVRIALNNLQINFSVFNNGAYQVNMNYTVSNITNFNKIAIKYKENDFALWINGTEVLTDTSGLTSFASPLDHINFSNANGNNQFFYGKTKALAVYKEALTDAELQSLTTI